MQVDHKARELLLLSAAELKASLALGSNPASGAAAGQAWGRTVGACFGRIPPAPGLFLCWI